MHTSTYPYDGLRRVGYLGEDIEVKDDGHLGIQWVKGSRVISMATRIATNLAKTAFQMLETLIEVS